MMFQVALTDEYILQIEGTSEGTQPKYKKDGYYYKLDSMGNEGLTEALVSDLLSCTDLREEEYVFYEQGYINGRPGCRSISFLKEEETFITLGRLYKNLKGMELSERLANFDTMEERAKYTVEFFKEYIHLDLTPYFQKIFTLDSIILNDDRHFYNMGVIMKGNRFSYAPIFDNGHGLLTANQAYNRNFSMEENVKRVTAKPFCGSFQRQREYFGDGFAIDHEKALTKIESRPAGREKEALLFQIRKDMLYKKEIIEEAEEDREDM